MKEFVVTPNNRGYLVGYVLPDTIKPVSLFGRDIYQATFDYTNSSETTHYQIPIVFAGKEKLWIERYTNLGKYLILRGKLASYNENYHLYVVFCVDKTICKKDRIYQPNIISLQAYTTAKKGFYVDKTFKNKTVLNWVCQTADYDEQGQFVGMSHIPVVFFGNIAKEINSLDENFKYKISMKGLFVGRKFSKKSNNGRIEKTSYEFWALEVSNIEKHKQISNDSLDFAEEDENNK